MTIYSVCQLPSGIYLHADLSAQEMADRSSINVIEVDTADHIDAYIQAKVPVEQIHPLFRGEVIERLQEKENSDG